MSAQRVFSIFFLTSLIAIRTSSARADCFDYSKPIRQPLTRPASLTWRSADESEPKARVAQGKKNDSIVWAAVQGESTRGVGDLLEELLSHETTRAGRVSKMEIKPETDPNFLARQSVHFEIAPFPFVTVEWTERWAFSLLSGKPASPKEILGSYEKIDGTSHIEHLCGNFKLTRAEGGHSRIFIYEEAQATGRSAEDTLHGILTTLKKLQGAH